MTSPHQLIGLVILFSVYGSADIFVYGFSPLFPSPPPWPSFPRVPEKSTLEVPETDEGQTKSKDQKEETWKEREGKKKARPAERGGVGGRLWTEERRFVEAHCQMTASENTVEWDC